MLPSEGASAGLVLREFGEDVGVSRSRLKRDLPVLLWHVILHQQLGTIRLYAVISAKKLYVVIFQIVIIIELESQAKLSAARQVDIRKGSAVEHRPIPAAYRIILDHTD